VSDPSFQDSLFQDPIGLRFRNAREKARLPIDQVARELRVPVAVIEAIEREDWARLGAPIFVRSHLGSYARHLGLPASLADEVVRGLAAPQLNIIGAAPNRRRLDRGLMKLIYLAMTVVLIGSVVVLAMYMQGPRGSAEVLPLDPPSLSAAGDDAPVLASLTPELPTPVAGGDIVLRLRAPSWVEIDARDGSSLERGLLPAGAERRYHPGQLGRVTLGDAAAVEVSRGGAVVDLAPYVEAKVARFTVSSAGEIVAATGD
jgi:cytoskeleton protein RodZ